MRVKYNTAASRKSYLPIFIVSISALLYVYEFFLRVTTSALADNRMQDLHIDAATLGRLSAAFYDGYTYMQIPAGMLGDRFGPRKLLIYGTIVCALSTLMFAVMDQLYFMIVARFFIGVASSFAYICSLMLAARWLNSKYFALTTGFIQLLGCMGAIMGGGPIYHLSQWLGWRTTLTYVGLIGIIIALLFYLFIQDYPEKNKTIIKVSKLSKSSTNMSEWQRISLVCKNPQTWWIAFIGFVFWAPMSIFAEQWGIPFMQCLYPGNAAQAASMTAWIWLGVIIGGPFMGWWSSFLNTRRIPIAVALIISLVSSIGAIYWHPSSLFIHKIFLFLFGVGASAQCITFGLVNDIHPPSVSGTAVGFNNMAVVTGGLTLMPLTGYILRFMSDGAIKNGVPIYHLFQYKFAFISIPIVSLLGLLVCKFCIKETFCHKASPSKKKDFYSTKGIRVKQ